MAAKPSPVAAPTSFEDWLTASRLGSSDELGFLLESCRAHLLVVAECELGSTLRPKAGASDLVQQSLLEAHRGFEEFRGSTAEEFLAWTSTILRRNLMDLGRRYRASESRSVAREVVPHSFDSYPSAIADPQAEASMGEELLRLSLAISQLPQETQSVIRLRHEEYLGWDEIGQRLNKSGEAVRKIWFRAVESLRSEMNKSDNDNERGKSR